MILESKIDELVSNAFSNISFPESPKGLYDPLRYMMSLGGKRLRPKLCLLSYSLWKESFGTGILEPAIALELFHNFTLIHDDIMDRSPLRRGKETVWKKWSEDTAVLSGDVLCIESYRRISQAPGAVLPKVMEVFTRTAAQVCEGQQMDADFEGREDVSMDEYMQMIGLKTGVLIACSAAMGAIIAEAPAKDVENLYKYGYEIGLAFQIADDYLDSYGDESVFGKPVGGDIVLNKKSWLTTRAFEKAGPRERSELIRALHMDASERSAKIDKVKSIYDSLGVPQDAQDEIIRLSQKGLDAAASSCEKLQFEILKRFALKLVGRTK